MDNIREKIKSIEEALKKINNYTKTSGPCFNSLFINERANYINILTDLQNDMNRTISKIENITMEAKYYQNLDLNKMTRAFNTYGFSPKKLTENINTNSGQETHDTSLFSGPWIDELKFNEPSFTQLAMRPSGAIIFDEKELVTEKKNIIGEFGISPDSGPELYRTESGQITAIIINSPNEIKVPGQLYYINGTRHFAIKIGSITLHGNIGKIFRAEKTPFKVKSCKYAQTCKNNYCSYYHDPFICPGDDIRNYVHNYGGPIANSITNSLALFESMGSGPELEEKLGQLNNLLMMGILTLMLKKMTK